MHMADALITPLVGGTMYIAALKVGNDSIHKIKHEADDAKIPLMGVMGAFVFATQMINFAIPGTGSSGHLGGGMLLAAILGPYAGFLTMSAILIIQSLLFADGGLLALGCNIFNLGFYTCFVAYPLVYKGILAKGYSAARITTASILASIVGLQLGALSVVVQTILSGKVDLPLASFFLLMQSIHLAIGIVEGFITAAVVNFLWKARPELVEGERTSRSATGRITFRRVLLFLVIAALVISGILSLYASGNPDGLEWALYKSTRQDVLKLDSSIDQWLTGLQNKVAILPDYSFKEGVEAPEQAGTSISGLTGAAVTLLLATGAGLAIKVIRKNTNKNSI